MINNRPKITDESYTDVQLYEILNEEFFGTDDEEDSRDINDHVNSQ